MNHNLQMEAIQTKKSTPNQPKFAHILPPYFQVLLKTYLLALTVFIIFRIILVAQHFEAITSAPASVWLHSLLIRGVAFDNVITTQFLIVPFLLASIQYWSQSKSKVWLKTATIINSITFTAAFGLCAADIPYFNYTSSRASINLFSWTDDLPSMFKAMFSSIEYIMALGLFLILSYLFNRIIWKWYKKNNQLEIVAKPIGKRIGIYFILIIMVFFGLRGRLRVNTHPLMVRDAFKTDYTLVNQLTLNGAHHFIHTLGESNHHYMDDEQAIALTKKYLEINETIQQPLARIENNGETTTPANVVLVLMESMSFEKVGWYHKEQKSLTPCLDSLINHSLFYPNTYSAGIRTANGIFSTLFSWPSIKNMKPTLSSDFAGSPLAGIPNILKSNGYCNLYFCNGTLDFDNIIPLFKQNGFDRLYGSESLPKEKIIGVWGVSDNTLLQQSLTRIDSVASTQTPFLAVYNTVTTHPPHIIPTNEPFTPTADNKRDQSYQYADWAIGQFIESASKKEWFNNTVFVFIADHGQNFNATYEMPLAYNHVPLLFYAPAMVQPHTDDRLALQIDVFPTIMGILKTPYVNNTMGVDLQKHRRPFAYFSADNKFGCLNEKYFMIVKDDKFALYDYTTRSTKDVAAIHPELVDSMKHYMQTMLQTTQYLVSNKKAGEVKYNEKIAKQGKTNTEPDHF